MLGNNRFVIKCVTISFVIPTIILISFLGIYFYAHKEPCFEPCNINHDDQTSTLTILSAVDSIEVNGSISNNTFSIYHIDGSIREKSVYRYYYQLDDGGIKLGEIPSKKTTIYYIGTYEKPYIEIIKSYKCYGYCPDLNEHDLKCVNITYKLYVPKGSILEVFQFDGN